MIEELTQTQTPHHDVVDLPVKNISYDPEDRLRRVDPKKVAELKPSIAEFGLLHPISVTKTDKPDNYLLRAGAHRFEAVKELGWTTVKAAILELGNVAARIAEIDENLLIATLSQSQRGDHLLKRKELYELLHPETKRGAAQGEGKKRSTAKTRAISGSQVGSEIVEELPKQPSFVEDTAAKTGLSETTISRDIERASKIPDDVKKEIAGTPLDTGKVLDELKDLSPEQQREKVKELQAAKSKPRAPKGKPAKPLPKGIKLTEEEKTVRDRTRLDKAWEPVRTAWSEACPPAQREFVRKLARDLNAEIKFAGEVMKPPPLSLTANVPSESRPDVP